MSENTPDFYDTMKFLNGLADTYFDVVNWLRQIARIPDTSWGGDEPREACFEMRRLAIDALFKLGAETPRLAEERKNEESEKETPCDQDEDKKICYEIRLGVYSKDFNGTRDFDKWCWSGDAVGRVEMIGPVPGSGDHREFGYVRMRIPVEQDLFDKVKDLISEQAGERQTVKQREGGVMLAETERDLPMEIRDTLNRIESMMEAKMPEPRRNTGPTTATIARDAVRTAAAAMAEAIRSITNAVLSRNGGNTDNQITKP